MRTSLEWIRRLVPRIRPNLVLFSMALTVTEALGMLFMTIVGRSDLLGSENTPLAMLAIALGLSMALKSKARKAFRRAEVDGRISWSPTGEAKILAKENEISFREDWLVQLHIEGNRPPKGACQSANRR